MTSANTLTRPTAPPVRQRAIMGSQRPPVRQDGRWSPGQRIYRPQRPPRETTRGAEARHHRSAGPLVASDGGDHLGPWPPSAPYWTSAWLGGIRTGRRHGGQSRRRAVDPAEKEGACARRPRGGDVSRGTDAARDLHPEGCLAALATTESAKRRATNGCARRREDIFSALRGTVFLLDDE